MDYSRPPEPEYGPPRAHMPYPPAPNINIYAPRRFNHGLHLALDFITCGFWVPVHLALWVAHKP